MKAVAYAAILPALYVAWLQHDRGDTTLAACALVVAGLALWGIKKDDASI